MVEHINQTKDHFGRNPITYRFENNQISVLPYFLYEVSADKLWKNGFCNLKSRYFKSNKFLKVKHTVETKRFDGYKVVRSITLLGAPYNFIKENNLPVYKLYSKKCQKRGK